MTYPEAIQYLYTQAPLFQNIGAGAYKEGLGNTIVLDEHFNHPHRNYKTIHVAGTNGKGSCAHTLASILQSSGYKVGLYTSPHLVDFRERIRVNGEMIPQERVIHYVENECTFFKSIHPSFFEVTTALAFLYFAEKNVDIAVIEVGMGGRLDCTNIISPILSVITNISLDHTSFLGNTLSKIAQEKAGIIKKNTPVVIGETQKETAGVFNAKAKEMESSIYFAQDNPIVISAQSVEFQSIKYKTTIGEIYGELCGEYQYKNTNTILWACKILKQKGLSISLESIKDGFRRVCELTGFQGRWQIVSQNPMIICDSGHNVGGLIYNMAQLIKIPHRNLRIVFGMVSDKDYDAVLKIMPKDAIYYFTKSSVKRALDEKILSAHATMFHLQGKTYPCVSDAVKSVLSEAMSDDVIYIGGSNFILSDFYLCNIIDTH